MSRREAEHSPDAVRITVAVILFCVMVPVLSEQITVAQPSVSTAWRRRTSAFFFTIRLTASASEMVTTAQSPSGTAATARLTPVISMSNSASPRKTPVMLTTAQISRQPAAIYLESWAKCFCRGVGSSSISVSIPAICPMRVRIPVFSTRNIPCPPVTVQPMLTSSPASFRTAADSPVSIDSSHESPVQ